MGHPLAAVLALCAAAVVAGMRSFTAIASWVGDVQADLLGCAYTGTGGQVPVRGPSTSTIWRVLTGRDGKTCRGAKGPDGRQVHLLAAMTHDTGLGLAQTDVAAKTNEVPRLKDLLSGLAAQVNLRGAILTVDALQPSGRRPDPTPSGSPRNG